MSSFSLKDLLTGAAARIAENGRQLVQSSNLAFAGQQSMDHANSFYTETGQMPLPDVVDQAKPTAIGYPTHWFKNTHPTKSLVVDSVYWTCDGGPLGADQYLCQFIGANPNLPPTGNIATDFQAAVAHRTNIGNVSAPAIEQYAWDGVGDGLTMPAGFGNPAEQFNAWRVGKGQNLWEWNGRIIMPPNAPAVLHIFDTEASLGAGNVINTSFMLNYYHVDLRAAAGATAAYGGE
jgi:hypothetical protein